MVWRDESVANSSVRPMGKAAGAVKIRGFPPRACHLDKPAGGHDRIGAVANQLVSEVVNASPVLRIDHEAPRRAVDVLDVRSEKAVENLFALGTFGKPAVLSA